MGEKRRSKRMELQSKLFIKRIDEQDNKEIFIEVMNVSKTGVGFYCEEVLEIGAIYEALLTIWTKEVIHVFLRIVRIEMLGENEAYFYGAIFIGMSDLDAFRIEVYQAVHDSQQQP